MPRHDYIPEQDLAAIAWAKRFVNSAEQKMAEAGFSQEQIDNLRDLVEAFANAKKHQQNCATKLTIATTAKNQAQKSLYSVLRAMAQQARHQPGAPATLAQALDLAPADPKRHKQRPQRPTAIYANTTGYGYVKVHWDKGANARGTVYVLQARVLPDGEWKHIAAVTAPRFVDKTQRPGVRVAYRVYAQRGDKVSTPCGGATAWGNVDPVQPKLLAA